MHRPSGSRGPACAAGWHPPVQASSLPPPACRDRHNRTGQFPPRGRDWPKARIAVSNPALSRSIRGPPPIRVKPSVRSVLATSRASLSGFSSLGTDRYALLPTTRATHGPWATAAWLTPIISPKARVNLTISKVALPGRMVVRSSEVGDRIASVRSYQERNEHLAAAPMPPRPRPQSRPPHPQASQAGFPASRATMAPDAYCAPIIRTCIAQLVSVGANTICPTTGARSNRLPESEPD